MFGRVTFQKTCQSEAPMVRAASSSARSMVSSIGISSRTTKGIVTKRVASAIPVPNRDKKSSQQQGKRSKEKEKKRTCQTGGSLQHVIHYTTILCLSGKAENYLA